MQSLYELTFFVVRGYIYLALASLLKSSLALIWCVYKGVRADGSSFCLRIWPALFLSNQHQPTYYTLSWYCSDTLPHQPFVLSVFQTRTHQYQCRRLQGMILRHMMLLFLLFLFLFLLLLLLFLLMVDIDQSQGSR